MSGIIVTVFKWAFTAVACSIIIAAALFVMFAIGALVASARE